MYVSHPFTFNPDTLISGIDELTSSCGPTHISECDECYEPQNIIIQLNKTKMQRRDDTTKMRIELKENKKLKIKHKKRKTL